MKHVPRTSVGNQKVHRRAFLCGSAMAMVMTLRPANTQTTEPAGVIEEIKGEGFAEIARRATRARAQFTRIRS